MRPHRSCLNPLQALLLLLSGLVCVAQVGSGCTGGRLESSVKSISPQEIFSGRSTLLTLEGTFYSQLALNSQTGLLTESWAYAGHLTWQSGTGAPPSVLEYPLEKISATSSTLTAEVAQGLPPGTYTLDLLDPAGYAVKVPEDATLLVPDRQADHLELSSNSRFLVAGSTLTVKVQVVYPDNSPAEGIRPVSLSLRNTHATFLSNTLQDPVLESTDSGSGDRELVLSGKVNASGSAEVVLTNSEVENFTLFSHSQDLNTFIPDGELDIVGLPSGFVGMAVVIPLDPSIEDPCGTLNLEADPEPTRATGEIFPAMIEAVDALGGRVPVESSVELLDVTSGSTAPLYPFPQPIKIEEGCWAGYLLYDAPQVTRLVAIGPEATYGFSPTLNIEVGPPRTYDVALQDSRVSVEAGVPFEVIALQQDGYDNLVPFSESTPLPTLSDSGGTLACADRQISGAEVRFIRCTVTRATAQDVLTVNNQAGAQGSLTIAVLSGPAQSIWVEGPETAIAAGTQQRFSLQLLDAYGNPAQDLSGQELLEVQMLTPEGVAGAPELLDLIRGNAEYLAQLTQANVYQLQARLLSLGLTGQSAWFEVVPAQVKGFRLTPCPGEVAQPCSIEAGGMLTLRVESIDAYQNLTGEDPGPWTLSSPSETLASAQAEYADLRGGDQTLQVSLTFADSAYTLTATLNADSAVAGESPPFEVRPGATVRIRVEDPQPVHWVDEPFEVTLSAVDKWENLTPSYQSTVLLSDRSGSLVLDMPSSPREPLPVPLVEGQAYPRLIVGSPIQDNFLIVTGQGIQGQGSPFQVFSRTCPTSLELSLTANGSSEVAVACIQERPGGEVVPAAVTYQGSSKTPVQGVVWDLGEGPLQYFEKLIPVTYSYQQPGRYQVTLYGIDKELCATPARIWTFTNFDNGSATGPVTLNATNPTLLAGQEGQSSTTEIAVQAYDCQGDTAVEGLLTLQTTLGALGLSDADPNEQGLQLDLTRRDGTGAFSLQVADERFSGTARVMASTQNKAATGAVTLTVLNDLVPPFVLDALPSGTVSTPVKTIEIRMSEPLRSGSALLTPEIRVESNLQGILPIDSVQTAQGDRLLILTLLTEQTWALGEEEITVTLPSIKGEPSLTDVEGNRLDGNYSGVADSEDSYVFRFGSGILPPRYASVLDCVVSPDVFSPDGQDGPGEEADLARIDVYYQWEAPPKAVGVLIQSDSTGEWTALFLQTDTLDLPGGASLSWTWAGSGLDGITQPNGVYTLEPFVLDANDNRTWLRCPGPTTSVSVGNPLDVGEEW